MVTKDLGMVTAYAYAVAGGYTGTEAQFEALLGNIAVDLDEIENLSVTVSTLPAGSSATASYNDGVLALGIPKGDQGIQGLKGDQGDKGEQGIQGLKGDTGNGIDSIAKTGTSGAEDTYTITFTDGSTTTFTVTNGEVTEEQMAAAIEEALEDYAMADGYYEEMTVGDAEQLVATDYVIDKEPYNFRTTGGSADVGNREYLDSVVGGTVAWNQLVKTTSFASKKTNGVTWTNNGDGTITANGTATADSYITISIPRSNHVYFCCGCPSNGSAQTYLTYLTGSGITYNRVSQDIGNGALAKPNQDVSSTVITYVLNVKTGTTVTNLTFKPQIIDLTQLFGTTIADHIYALEQATAGAGVAWFKALFPKAYYPYNAGELMSVQTDEHWTVGFNQWDEEWELGTISTSTGQNGSNNTLIRSTNYIPCVPNTQYYQKAPSGTGGNLFFYDADKNYISYVGMAVNLAFTTPSNARYMRFRMGSAYGTTYKNDICINLSWSGYRNGDYEPYVKRTYPLDTLTLRGIPKLDSSGNLYYDGDEYKPDGAVTRKYGVVDLGTFTWNYNQTYSCWQTANTQNLVKGHTLQGDMINFVAEKYVYDVVGNLVAPTFTDGKFIVGTSKNMFVKNGSTTTQPTGLLVYELATETTETADPYQQIQICDDFGTEGFTDSRTVPIPVGHETRYPENLRDKLQHLPSLASEDGVYAITQDDSKMTLTPISAAIPAAPPTDGTYNLKCVVANGTQTMTWEVDS